MTEQIPESSRQQACQWLDETAASLDVDARINLARARARAAALGGHRRWQSWAMGGAGFAAAMALALVMLSPPEVAYLPPEADALLLLSVEKQELQVAEEMLFLLWLEQQHGG